jgi:3-dehydroquinate synthase
VRTPGGAYPVIIGSGALDKLPSFLGGKRRPSSLHLVSDRKVYRRYGGRVEKLLRRGRLSLSRTLLPAGESSKSFAQLERIVRGAISEGCDRRACLVALGGGVVGDITGFAAASLLRGVPFLQVPTSLLAMVDASVGGKTGINVLEGKNLVGAFHQPIAVVMDLDVLETLPKREVRAGWAEIIKTAAIWDERLLRLIERQRDALVAGDPALMARVIERCVRIKAAVVEEDEKESGLRMILNFGHTLAHGIEVAQGYGKLLHGEAVAIGMVFAARLGEALGRTPRGVAERVEALIRAFGLPTCVDGARLEALWSAMARDKKRGPKGLRWVLLARAGEAMICDDVPEAFVRRELRRFIQ